jgi:5-methylcytosine-specific restriction endonuclease McrA
VTEAEERCGSSCECYGLCDCGRGWYSSHDYSSCYECFLDRRADYMQCLYCGRWHSPEFDTCFACRPQGRDEAARDIRLVIFARDSFKCRYCDAMEGDLQTDPRLIRPACAPSCAAIHQHRRPCRARCRAKHSHRDQDDPVNCGDDCCAIHDHRLKDDDGIRPVKLHIDHIMPCAKGGTAEPWNLQTLCGVCNISKGSDWWTGSRHHRARLVQMDAYATYLAAFLSDDEMLSLYQDIGSERDLGHLSILGDPGHLEYVDRVKRQRPRPSAAEGIRVEDLPAEYAHLDQGDGGR